MKKNEREGHPQLTAVLDALPTIANQLYTDGWKKYSMGRTYDVYLDYRFDLYVRQRNLADVKDQKSNLFQKGYSSPSEKPLIYKGFSMVSKAPMGCPEPDLTPSAVPEVVPTSTSLPVLSDFDNYPSLRAARTNSPALVIAYDSEWFHVDGDESEPREMLSWQFACVKDEDLYEFIFLRKLEKYKLTLELATGRILDFLGVQSVDLKKIRKYVCLGDVDKKTGIRSLHWFDTRSDAVENSKALFEDGRKVQTRYDWSLVPTIPVVLLCHTGKVDVSAMDQHGKRNKDILKYCSEVQGGLVSLQPTFLHPYSLNPRFFESRFPHQYNISLQIADTMCHAPSRKKSLKALGEVIDWNKIDLGEEISKMNELLQTNPKKYFEYASNDAVVALLYAAALYGYNRKLPVTLTSAGAKGMKDMMMKYLHCDNTKEFDRKARGLHTVGHGLVPRPDRPGFTEATSKEPISDKANTIQYYASQAYHGGYNGSFEIGSFPFVTFDYDLRNAYPTAMCLVSDVDWENPVRSEIINRQMTLNDFAIPVVGGFNPVSMFVGYVRFSFPLGVRFPCISVNVDGVPVYPRTSDGLDGVYATGPEIYLALRLGADVWCERGYFLNSLINGDTGEMSYAMRYAVKQFVDDRNRAIEEHGKGCIEELIAKDMGNSGYGKVSQDVVQKTSWSAMDDTMEDLGPSAITNPVSACLITAIVRCELIAAQNQAEELGYKTLSVTTDGFISDMPEDVVKSLDLYGFRKFMEQSRLFLTNNENAELWEIKHAQDDLVNFTTRGNVSLHVCKKPDDDDAVIDNPMVVDGKKYNGVCAHNSFKTGKKNDSYEDRFSLMKTVLSRTSACEYTDNEWTKFKDLVRGEEFKVTTITRHIRMDFDMKRKPDRQSFSQHFVELDGETYEIMNFTTIPFQDVAEFKEYRQRKETVACLRTKEDWDMFWFKTDKKSTKAKVRDMEWSVLFSCIVGHRAGFWKIPKLDMLTGEGRCAWINTHNTSKKKFTVNDWKNASRNDRQANMLSRNLLTEKLEELMSD